MIFTVVFISICHSLLLLANESLLIHFILFPTTAILGYCFSYMIGHIIVRNFPTYTDKITIKDIIFAEVIDDELICFTSNPETGKRNSHYFNLKDCSHISFGNPQKEITYTYYSSIHPFLNLLFVMKPFKDNIIAKI